MAGLDETALDRIWDLLRRSRIQVPIDPGLPELRRLLSDLRGKRNRLLTAHVTVARKLARLKAELVHLDRKIERETARMLSRNEGMLGARNAAQKQARVRHELEVVYDERASIRADVEVLDLVLGSVRVARDELRGAFDEVSRSLACLELDWKIESGRQ